MNLHSNRRSLRVNALLREWSFWLFPPRCLDCGTVSPEPRDLCNDCFGRLARQAETLYAHPSLSDAPIFAPFRYQEPISQWIQHFKYPPHQLSLGDLLADLLVQEIQKYELPRPTAILPIPSHRHRLRERGFDQCRELARGMSRRLGIPVLPPRTLVRVKNTLHNANLSDWEARTDNLRDAFQLLSPLPASVALLDDVFTTGATFAAAVDAIRSVDEAVNLQLWAIARA